MAHGQYILGCRDCGLEPCSNQFNVSCWIPVYWLCIGRNIFYISLNMSDSWLLCPCMSLRLIKELRAHRNYILGCRGYGLEPYTLQFKISSWIPDYWLCIGRNILNIQLNMSDSLLLFPYVSLRLIKEFRAHRNHILQCSGYGLEPYTLQLKISSWIVVYCLCIGRNILYSPMSMSGSYFL